MTDPLNTVKAFEPELGRGAHSIAQFTGGLCHAVVVHDQLANVAAKAFRRREMNRIKRSELMWLQHAGSGQDVVADAYEIASSQDGSAGRRRLVTAWQQGAQDLGSSEATRNPGASAS